MRRNYHNRVEVNWQSASRTVEQVFFSVEKKKKRRSDIYMQLLLCAVNGSLTVPSRF